MCDTTLVCGPYLIGAKYMLLSYNISQVSQTSEALRQTLINNDPKFIRFPNLTCRNVFERMNPDMEDSELHLYAPDGHPLTQPQVRHMQKNRFRCDVCTSNFCCNCNKLPYHTAATCKQAVAERCKAKCCVCQAQLPPGKKDGISCGSSECAESKRSELRCVGVDALEQMDTGTVVSPDFEQPQGTRGDRDGGRTSHSTGLARERGEESAAPCQESAAPCLRPA